MTRTVLGPTPEVHDRPPSLVLVGFGRNGVRVGALARETPRPRSAGLSPPASWASCRVPAPFFGPRGARRRRRIRINNRRITRDDSGLIAKYHWMLHRVRAICFGFTRRFGRLQTQHRVTAGLAERVWPQGPKDRPRKERTDEPSARQHQVAKWRGAQGCVRCGRTSCKGKRQAIFKQWRNPCVELQVHRRDFDNGHRLAWVGGWRCAK